MSNVEKGRYYWLKLKEDFFEDDAIEWLEEQKNGKEYALFYLKLCLKSLKSNGTLIRRVGTMLVPYDTEKLAEITKTDFDTVVVAMELLKKIGLIEVLDTGEIYISSLSDMVGSESRSAERVRKFRERQKQAAELSEPLPELPEPLQCNAGVTPCNAQFNREKELEKEIELEIEKEREKEAAAPLPSPSPEKKKKSKTEKQVYGEYGHVFLTAGEYDRLSREYGKDQTEAAIRYLDEYIEDKGNYKSKSHNLALRRWVFDALQEKRSKVIRPQYGNAAEIVTINGKQYEKRNGKYYVPGGSGVAVNPYEQKEDSLFKREGEPKG